jgi:Ca-activated chloride channel family protein
VSFEAPLALLGLLLVPVLVGLVVLHERGRRAQAAQFGNPALLPNVVDRAPGRWRFLPLAVLLVALCAMIVGVARPHATLTVPREEATVMIAIDVSRSMKAKDVVPTRLDAARNAAKAFVAKVPEKFRIGVVSFGSGATVAVPPTADRSLVTAALDSLKPGEGTALGDAVVLAAQLGGRQRAADGTTPPTSVLVISDGARVGGRTSPQAAARRARTLRVPVYTVLLGTQNGVVEETLTGGFRATIRVPPSPGTLRQIARATGGESFTATDAAGLGKVYEQLRSRLGHRRQDREVTQAFAGGSALLLLAGAAVSLTLFRRVP